MRGEINSLISLQGSFIDLLVYRILEISLYRIYQDSSPVEPSQIKSTYKIVKTWIKINADKGRSLGSIYHNKCTWKLQTRFKWVCTWGIMKRATSTSCFSWVLSNVQSTLELFIKDQSSLIDTACYVKKWQSFSLSLVSTALFL
jgi:hypothetical protein